MLKRCHILFLYFIFYSIQINLSFADGAIGIIGNDDRQLNNNDEYPWSAIGRVNIRPGGFCTGTIIAKNKVLTAAHCLWNKRTNTWFPPQSLHFVAGYRKGNYLRASAVISIRASKNFRHETTPTLINSGADFAVLTLEKYIGKSVGIIKISTKTIVNKRAYKEASNDITQAGYSQDKAHILTIDRDCSIINLALEKNILFHNCDAVAGDSGSPILKIIEGQHQLIAVHVGNVEYRGSRAGLAVVPTGVTY
jgi:protease YdgD